MMRQYELVELVAEYNGHANEQLLNRAYVYSMQKHGGQTRASGDPYFSHPLEVAAILTRMRLDDATIAVALLHDVLEDTDATRAEIDRLFGPEIGELVQGLTKIKRLQVMSQEDKQGENLRTLLVAVSKDVRVLLVKLADRLHNMRTLKWVPVDKRERIARETMEVYAPLAGKMGIQWMREELEALAFKVLHPVDAEAIESRLAQRRTEVGTLLADIASDLTERLAEAGIAATVSGREKQPYAIFSKMQRKDINFENLSDVYGFRIIVDTVPACYAALGVIHTVWQSVPGRFKDYISTPKQNDYRSLHTTVVGPRKQRVELQIRTEAMHRIAEYGVAAHALYKDYTPRRAAALAQESQAYAWLRQTIDILDEEGSSGEFLEHTKLELFQDRVFCFTPRGKLIALPVGATPIDFAYQVHTDVGNTAVGCRINGHERPLFSPLQTGDEVEILRREGATPPSAWKALAVTGKARAAIRRANREADRKRFIRLGNRLIGSEMSRRGIAGTADVDMAAEALGRPDAEALLLDVGHGTLRADEVIEALGYRAADNVRERPCHALPIRGVGAEVPVRFASDHTPIPGDAIVGISGGEDGITIYPAAASDALSRFAAEPDRWVDVAWDDSRVDAVFSATIMLKAANACGTLASIAYEIAQEGSNIGDIALTRKNPQFVDMTVHLEVRDRDHLIRILERLRALDIVSEAKRAAV